MSAGIYLFNLKTVSDILDHPVRSDIFQFLSACAHLRYRCLNDPKVGAVLTDSGRLFHILGPE